MTNSSIHKTCSAVVGDPSYITRPTFLDLLFLHRQFVHQ